MRAELYYRVQLFLLFLISTYLFEYLNLCACYFIPFSEPLIEIVI